MCFIGFQASFLKIKPPARRNQKFKYNQQSRPLKKKHAGRVLQLFRKFGGPLSIFFLNLAPSRGAKMAPKNNVPVRKNTVAYFC